MELELWVGAEGTLDGVTHWHGSSLFCAISVMQLPELVAKSKTCCSCALTVEGIELGGVAWKSSLAYSDPGEILCQVHGLLC